jgi:hypothetical protein
MASEVFEHVEAPVSKAFQNAAVLLKETGVLLLTVPWVWDGDPRQAIPELYDWRLDREADGWSVTNRKPDGTIERFDNMALDDTPGPCFGFTREHFPKLNEWEFVSVGNSRRLVNRRPDRSTEIFENLVFHQGSGFALEMRLFTKRSLERSLHDAGFPYVEFEGDNNVEDGIIFPYPWTRPLAARKARR